MIMLTLGNDDLVLARPETMERDYTKMHGYARFQAVAGLTKDTAV